MRSSFFLFMGSWSFRLHGVGTVTKNTSHFGNKIGQIPVILETT